MIETTIDPSLSERESEWQAFQSQLQNESAIAKKCILEDQWPLDQNLQEIICDEHDRQRERVQKLGHCETPCGRANWVIDIRGETVCKWTRQPCVKFRLAQLVDLYSQVNRVHQEEVKCLL